MTSAWSALTVLMLTATLVLLAAGDPFMAWAACIIETIAIGNLINEADRKRLA